MKKLFISHCERDRKYVDALVSLLWGIGIPRSSETIFCSSYPGLDGRINEDFVERISSELENKEVYVIFLMSSHFLSSDMCKAEAGRICLDKKRYMTLLAPGFQIEDLPAPFDKRRICIRLEDKFGLNAVKTEIEQYFGLCPVDPMLWEQDRDKFILEIRKPPDALDDPGSQPSGAGSGTQREAAGQADDSGSGTQAASVIYKTKIKNMNGNINIHHT